MLKNIHLFTNICKNSVNLSGLNKITVPRGTGTLFEALKCDSCLSNQNEGFHTSLPRTIDRDIDKHSEKNIKKMYESKKHIGSVGETSLEYDSLISRRPEYFPDENLPNTLFNGIPFKDLPIIRIRSSRNNTIMSLTDSAGRPLMIRSCGIDGFKNAKKGTNVAAQATGTNFGTLVLKAGYDTVRVGLNGLGPGRLGGIKGLQISGVKIVSVTDTTPFSDNPPRAKKRRRL